MLSKRDLLSLFTNLLRYKQKSRKVRILYEFNKYSKKYSEERGETDGF